MGSSASARPAEQLTPGERELLEAGHRRLSEAVVAYDEGVAGTAGRREATWAPPATFVVDWFSEEDRAYDELAAEADWPGDG
ncbi:MAG: hypothetical protein ACYDH5_10365 [Acidimicrobiales bacterium]